MDYIESGVTAPLGFRASSASAGIKKNNRKDIALIFSPVPCRAAGVFTTNALKAAPVVLSQEKLKCGLAQAVIINSGNANSITGKRGLKDARLICDRVASLLNVDRCCVLPASTGIIGRPLPLKKMFGALNKLVDNLSRNGGANAASSIMTTDTFRKECAVEFKIGKRSVRIGGMAKGAGMIAPNMATMLCFLTTDAAIEQGALKAALKSACAGSFNAIIVDGDMSTNDSCFLLANSLAGNDVIRYGTEDYKKFLAALSAVTTCLAKMIVEDGEGATKFVTIKVKGAKTKDDAIRAAKSIANSPLVKTAMFGADPNWGRIASGVGQSGIRVKEGELSIAIQNKTVLRSGVPVKLSAGLLRRLLKKRDIHILAGLKGGSSEAVVYTTDLSPKYVRINSRYST